jgi:hypothetical protein
MIKNGVVIIAFHGITQKIKPPNLGPSMLFLKT